MQKKKKSKCGKGDLKKQNIEKNKAPKCAPRKKLFLLNEEAERNSLCHACNRRTELTPRCVVMTDNICITNQAYQDITRIIFQIQNMLAMLPVTPAAKKTIQSTARAVDCDGNRSDLAKQQ